MPAASTAMALATSIELPPPSPTTPSASPACSIDSASSTTDSAGSAVTSEKRPTCSHVAAIASRTGSTKPTVTKPGSVTSSGRLIPSWAQYAPTSREVPRPTRSSGAVLNR